MPTDLPITAIGLIAFICAGAATLIWRLQTRTLTTFMTYIEKKNNNLERTSKEFSSSMEKVAQTHKDTVEILLKSRV